MFTGLVTMSGGSWRVRTAPAAALRIAVRLRPRRHRARRLDRVLRPLPHRGGRRAARPAARGSTSTPPRRRWRAPPSAPGARARAINLERSLKIGDELGGHLVTGHVDGVATIMSREEVTGGEWGPTARFVSAPRRADALRRREGLGHARRHLAHRERRRGRPFTVLIIPHTLAVTTWGERGAGDRLNLEVDLMARYAARLVEAGQGGRGLLEPRLPPWRRRPPVERHRAGPGRRPAPRRTA